jgi:Mg-chelatase subunit ChlD
MAGSRLIQAKEGSLAFAREALKKGYSVGLIRFAGTAEVLCYPKDGLDALESKLQRLGVAGGTNMTDALDLAVRELAPLSGARVIVIATDGEPDSRSSSLQAAQRARTAGIDIIAIGTEDADKGFLALSRRLQSYCLARVALKSREGRANARVSDLLSGTKRLRICHDS